MTLRERKEREKMRERKEREKTRKERCKGGKELNRAGNALTC